MTINPNNTTAACSGSDLDLAEAGLRHAEGLTAQLEKSDWKPSRAHIEQARNSIKKLSDILRTQASAPRSASAGDGVREALAVMSRVKSIGVHAKHDTRETYVVSLGFEGEQPTIRQFEALKEAALASNPLEGKGIQSKTEQASSGVRSTKQREG